MAACVRAPVRLHTRGSPARGARARKGAFVAHATAPQQARTSAPLPYASPSVDCLPSAGAAGRAHARAQAREMRLHAMDASAVPAPEPAEAPAADGESLFEKASNVITNLFPIWTVLAAGVGLYQPATFTWLSTSAFTYVLAALMFSMGLTMTVDDFKRVFTRPKVVAIGFVACYVLMPALAFGIGKALGLTDALLAGLVVVGAINGGQASNLCTYIAKGDVALSVLMTTSTTIGCIFMTPLISKLVLGAVVPVDAVGIAMDTIKVVLAPIMAGLALNSTVPKFCRAVEPICPVIGVFATIVLVGASVAKCSADILAAGMALQAACILLHAVGGVAGYWFNRAFGYDETTCRTTAIETSMKSSAFGFVLAANHFGAYLVRVPPAVSVVWMAVIGSTMAVLWRGIPVPGEEGK
mmetsp:Transcript_19225/g.65381  ORF Transcript_19225/g.65381 Transcript_19225/m.65381 type:complete len:412 (+) Transcript_19225:47-1282(+)